MSERRAPDRVTMPLLSLITRQSLDEDYLHVAEQRASGELRRAATGGHRSAAAAVVVFGLLVSTAAVQTSRDASTDSASRTALIDQIGERRAEVAAAQEQIATLRIRNAALGDQQRTATTSSQQEATQLTRLQARTGFGAVSGPGVRVTVSDAPGADPVDDPAGLVTDEDLGLLVNGLWRAGAEAIAVNGQRLSSVSAIRNSGVVVRVNRSPVASPYVVSAIGDNRTLQADLYDTTTGLQFQANVDDFGFGLDVQNASSLSLPATPDRLLRLRSVRAGTGTGKPPASQEVQQ